MDAFFQKVFIAFMCRCNYKYIPIVCVYEADFPRAKLIRNHDDFCYCLGTCGERGDDL